MPSDYANRPEMTWRTQGRPHICAEVLWVRWLDRCQHEPLRPRHGMGDEHSVKAAVVPADVGEGIMELWPHEPYRGRSVESTCRASQYRRRGRRAPQIRAQGDVNCGAGEGTLPQQVSSGLRIGPRSAGVVDGPVPQSIVPSAAWGYMTDGPAKIRTT